MYVKPKDPKLVIRDPRTFVRLPVEGARVPDTSYWHRRLNDGDVVITTKAEKEPSKGKK